MATANDKYLTDEAMADMADDDAMFDEYIDDIDDDADDYDDTDDDDADDDFDDDADDFDDADDYADDAEATAMAAADETRAEVRRNVRRVNGGVAIVGVVSARGDYPSDESERYDLYEYNEYRKFREKSRLNRTCAYDSERHNNLDFFIRANIKKGDYSIRRVNLEHCARYLIDNYHFCIIDDIIAYTTISAEVLDDDNTKARPWLDTCNPPMLYEGSAGNAQLTDFIMTELVNIANRFNVIRAKRLAKDGEPVPEMLERPVLWLDFAPKVYEDIIKTIRIILDADPTRRHYTSDPNSLLTADGTYIVYNAETETVECRIPRLSDHVLASRAMSVKFDEGATWDSSPVARRAYEALHDQWAGGDEDSYLRLLDCNFTSIACRGIPRRRIVVNISSGGSGKSAVADLRRSLFGDNVIYNCQNLNNVSNRFELGRALGKACIFVDEGPLLPVSTDATGVLKQLSGSHQVSAERKGDNAEYHVQDVQVVINTNHPIDWPQREAGSDAIQQRLEVYTFRSGSVDSADPSTRKDYYMPDIAGYIASDDTAMSALLNAVIARMPAYIRRGCPHPCQCDRETAALMLASVDTVGGFLEHLGGDLYGADMTSPRLARVGQGGRDRAIVFPLWAYKQMNQFRRELRADDLPDRSLPDKARCYELLDGSLTDRAGHDLTAALICERTTLYGLYCAWHHTVSPDGKARLSSRSFYDTLSSRGYVTNYPTRVNGKVVRIVVPRDVTDATAFDEFYRAQVRAADATAVVRWFDYYHAPLPVDTDEHFADDALALINSAATTQQVAD